MKLDKAIEILEHNYQAQPRSWYKDYFTALKLGIEALKAIRLQRTLTTRYKITGLPGETKE